MEKFRESPARIFQDDFGPKTNVSVLSFYVGFTFLTALFRIICTAADG